MTLQEGCNKILVSDCFTLLERQFHNISRGLYSHKETQCGGCGGRIVLRPTQDSSSSSSSSIPSHSESSIYCDTFVFNCKHAFHIECLPADDHHNKEDFMTTNCSLCTSSKKKRFWIHTFILCNKFYIDMKQDWKFQFNSARLILKKLRKLDKIDWTGQKKRLNWIKLTEMDKMGQNRQYWKMRTG